MKLIVEAKNRDLAIEVGDQPSVLHAGLRSGFDLPYECATGTCGTCIAEVVDGDVEQLWRDAPGLKGQRSANNVLLCQCRMLSSCRFKVDAHVFRSRASIEPPLQTSGILNEVRLLTPGMALAKVSLDQPVHYEAGQFFNVGVKSITGRRAYSAISWSPDETNELAFLIRHKPDGSMTDWFFNSEVPIGERLEILGPYGRATFHPWEKKDLLIAAGGSGLAGMLAMLERAHEEGYFVKHRGRVIFGVRRNADAFFLQELERYAAAWSPNLEIVVALSDEEPEATLKQQFPSLIWERGFVHDVLGARIPKQMRNVIAFLAGPEPAVDGCIHKLLGAGTPATNIRYDKFS